MSQTTLGELASLGSAVAWAISICLFRRYGQGIPSYTLTLFKNVTAIVGYALILLLLGVSLPREPEIWRPLVISGVLGIAVGDTAAFVVLRAYGAQAAAASYCLSPPLVAVMGYLFLGEHLTTEEWIGMILCVIGVAGVIFLGSRDSKEVPAGLRAKWLPIACICLSPLANSAGILLARDAMPQVHSMVGTLYRVLPATCALLLLQLRRHPFRIKGTQVFQKPTFAGLFAASFIGTFVGLLLMSVGLQYTKAGVAATLTSTYPLWVIPISKVFLGESASLGRVLCIALAIVGIVLLVWGH